MFDEGGMFAGAGKFFGVGEHGNGRPEGTGDAAQAREITGSMMPNASKMQRNAPMIGSQRGEEYSISQIEKATGDYGNTGDAKTSMKILMDKGWTKEQAAGITANLKAESNFKTKAKGDSGLAKGIAQWHPDRQQQFEKVYGKPLSEATFEEQVGFVDWELKHTEKAAGEKIKATSTPEEAAAATEQHYERSKLGGQGGVQQQRVDDSAIFSQYSTEELDATKAKKDKEQLTSTEKVPEEKIQISSIQQTPTTEKVPEEKIKISSIQQTPESQREASYKNLDAIHEQMTGEKVESSSIQQTPESQREASYKNLDAIHEQMTGEKVESSSIQQTPESQREASYKNLDAIHEQMTGEKIQPSSIQQTPESQREASYKNLDAIYEKTIGEKNLASVISEPKSKEDFISNILKTQTPIQEKPSEIEGLKGAIFKQSQLNQRIPQEQPQQQQSPPPGASQMMKVRNDDPLLLTLQYGNIRTS
jgi:hypothetical protein